MRFEDVSIKSKAHLLVQICKLKTDIDISVDVYETLEDQSRKEIYEKSRKLPLLL